MKAFSLPNAALGLSQRGELRHRLRVLPERWFNRAWEKVETLYAHNGRSERAAAYVDGLLSCVCIPVPLTASDAEIVALAESLAKKHEQLNGCATVFAALADAERTRDLNAWGLTFNGVARLACPRWWKRQIRHRLNHQTEVAARSFGYVGGRGDRYVSHESHARNIQRQKINQAVIAAAEIEDEGGNRVRLKACVDASVSNPQIRRAELMTRVRGFEEIAAGLGHECVFLTPTLPSRFHPVRANGSVNERFDGSSVYEGQRYLCTQWARFRARLSKLGVHPYGFRVAEPHKSGTVHWHIMLFAAQSDRELVCKHFIDCFTQDAGEGESTAHRCKIEFVDPEKGTPTGYISKYVSKNIDGAHMGEGEKTNAIRVRSWASVHRIRQFQQFGGPRVGVWREIRRISRDQLMEAGDVHRELAMTVHRNEERLADWAAYCRLIGSIDASGARTSVALEKVWSDRLNAYGEAQGERVHGVRIGMMLFPTREKVWRVDWRGSSREARSGSRTGFNNCNSSIRSSNVEARPESRYIDAESMNDVSQNDISCTHPKRPLSGVKSPAPESCYENFSPHTSTRFFKPSNALKT